MTAKPSYDLSQGMRKINASQFLVFLLVLLGIVVVYNTYQHNTGTVGLKETPPPIHNVTQKRLMQNIAIWKAGLQKKNVALVCPYLGHDFVARVDLPDKRPVTLDDWDYASETRIALESYINFSKARQNARVADPDGCIVHVFDSTGEEVAQASQRGVITSQFEPIPGSADQ